MPPLTYRTAVRAFITKEFISAAHCRLLGVEQTAASSLKLCALRIGRRFGPWRKPGALHRGTVGRGVGRGLRPWRRQVAERGHGLIEEARELGIELALVGRQVQMVGSKTKGLLELGGGLVEGGVPVDERSREARGPL